MVLTLRVEHGYNRTPAVQAAYRAEHSLCMRAAFDTFYKWPEYGELIGGYFDNHPWHQEVTIKVEDPEHPATRHFGTSFKLTDEIYQFKDFARARVNVLLSLDAGSVDLNKPGIHRADRDFALAWWRNYGRGRVFYTALGHRAEVWQDARYQQHLLGALRWVMKQKAEHCDIRFECMQIMVSCLGRPR